MAFGVKNDYGSGVKLFVNVFMENLHRLLKYADLSIFFQACLDEVWENPYIYGRNKDLYIMDRVLGSIIDDNTLYRILESIIVILYMFLVYLGIQIALTWKFIKKERRNSDEIIFQKGSFIRTSIFISITGFFMPVYDFFEGFGKLEPDSTTYELFKLIAFLGLVLFFYEWYKLLNKIKKADMI